MQWFSKRSIAGEFLQLSIPTVLAGWIYAIYSVADGVFIGRYIGSQALAALNLALPVLYVPYAFGLLIGVGGATLMSRMRGEGAVQEARRVAAQTLVALLVVGALLMLPLLLFPHAVATSLGAHGILAKHCSTLLCTYAVFIPFACAGPALGFLLRAENPRSARICMLAMGVGACLNAGLDYLFIARLGMQMEGAALATGIGHLGAAVVMLLWFRRASSTLLPDFSQGPGYYWQICYNGMSEFFSAIAPVITIYAFNLTVVKLFGTPGLAAYAVMEYMTLGAIVTMLGLVQSMQPMISFYRGANKPVAMRRTMQVAVVSILGCAAFFALGTIGFADVLVRLILPEGREVWGIIGGAVPWYALAFLPAGVNLLVAGYLTAIERPGASLVIAVLRSLVLLLVFLWLLQSLFGAHAIWLTLLFTELGTVLASAALVLRYRVSAVMLPLRRASAVA
jgi:Na+-driven multidrug efflux pump